MFQLPAILSLVLIFIHTVINTSSNDIMTLNTYNVSHITKAIINTIRNTRNNKLVCLCWSLPIQHLLSYFESYYNCLYYNNSNKSYYLYLLWYHTHTSTTYTNYKWLIIIQLQPLTKLWFMFQLPAILSLLLILIHTDIYMSSNDIMTLNTYNVSHITHAILNTIRNTRNNKLVCFLWSLPIQHLLCYVDSCYYYNNSNK